MQEIILIVLMWIVTICMYISYIPQLYKLLKTKQSEDISAVSWILWSVSALCDTAYSIILGRPELIVASVSELLLNVAVLVFTVKYNKCVWFINDLDDVGGKSYTKSCDMKKAFYCNKFELPLRCDCCGKLIKTREILRER